MNFLEFQNHFIEIGCISTHQIKALKPGFNANNLTRWVKQGLLVKLRQGFYTFPSLKNQPGFVLYVSNRIYKPSYISLHTALAFYGIIPEAVTQVTAVATIKPTTFHNDFGTYTYKKVREDSILFATPEKALIDLFYLYPFYNSNEEIEELRLDEDYLADDLNVARLDEYLARFKNKALEKRIEIMKKIYGL
jgi:predicted transcriptional regulator of viral defense system